MKAMRRTAALAVLLLAAPAAACGQAYGGGTGTGGAGEGDGSKGPLDAEVLDFQADGFAQRRGGALGDDPIDPEKVFGRDGEAPDPVDRDVAYVAVSSLSGCYLATGADLHREGDDLRVEFDIDKPPGTIQCIRSFEPYVQFAVDADAVKGVETINGQPPITSNA